MTEMTQSYTTTYDIQHTFGRATQYEYDISESVPVVISESVPVVKLASLIISFFYAFLVLFVCRLVSPNMCRVRYATVISSPS